METFLQFSFVFMPFLFVTWFAGRLIGWCQRQGMVAPVAHDDVRRAHSVPTPHGGGLALVAGILPPALLAVWLFDLPHSTFLVVLCLASLPLAFVGWLDDRRHQPEWLRLTVHLGCVLVGVWFLPPMFDLFPLWLEKLILVLAWGWFVNLFNFLDGIDGHATTEAVVIAVGLILLGGALAPVAGIIAGACLGFLRVNWQPARIFLGDVGSTFLGFMLGGLLLVSATADTWTLIWPLFTITLVFSLDATATVIRRILQGHKPWVPHQTFWFQRAVKAGLTHSEVVRAALVINLALLVLAILMLLIGLPWLSPLFGVLMLIFVARWIQKHEHMATIATSKTKETQA